MESNYTLYSIIIYVIIIVLLVMTKPNFMYDNNKKQYREFGRTKDKTIFTLPVVAILLAVLLVVLFNRYGYNNKSTKSKKKSKIKYIPIPMNYMPQISEEIDE